MERLVRVDANGSRPLYDAIMAAADSIAVPIHGMTYEEFVTQNWPTTAYFVWRDEQEKDLVFLSLCRDRDIVSNSAELGIVATREGLGHGEEAFKAIARMAFDDLGIHRLHAVVNEDNEACIGMLKRIGVRQEGRRKAARWKKGRWIDLIEFAATADERELCLPQQQ